MKIVLEVLLYCVAFVVLMVGVAKLTSPSKVESPPIPVDCGGEPQVPFSAKENDESSRS